jgi:hypothetical protein
MSNESKLDTSAIETLVQNIVTGLQKVASDAGSPNRLHLDRPPRIKLADTERVGAQIRSELKRARKAHRTLIGKRRSELEKMLVLRKKRLEEASRPKPPVVGEEQGSFIVRGRVVDENEGIGLPNVVVKAFDLDRQYDDQLGSTRTDEHGYYAIEYSAKAFNDVFDKQPETYIEVLDSEGNSLYTSPRSFVHKAGAIEKIDASVDGHRLEGQLDLAKKRLNELELQRKETEARGTLLSTRGLRTPVP